MNEAIKPCPLCGGKAEVETNGTKLKSVSCTRCGASNAWNVDAIKNWNTRKNVSPLLLCPICGKKVQLHYITANLFVIKCDGCKLISPLYESEEEAIHSWNNRLIKCDNTASTVIRTKVEELIANIDGTEANHE